MYKARYYKADGKKGRARALPDTLFDGVVNEAVMHLAVKAYQANQRQGTASAKTRSEVRGGGRKPWRQKGTGRARQGTIRAAQWEGGGVAFPPIPHSWRQKLPKKVRSLARRSALNDRAERERVILLDMPDFAAPKTKEILALLAALDADGKVLLLTDGHRETVYLSARNLDHVEVRPFGTESVYDLLWAQTVVIERSAVEGESAKAKAAQAAADAAPDAVEDTVEGVDDETADADEAETEEATDA